MMEGKNDGSCRAAATDECPSVTSEDIKGPGNRIISGSSYSIADVNMEASISPEDIICAGGLGATDDIGSIFPVASDSTDFEARLIEAQECEPLEDATAGTEPGNESLNMGAPATCDEMIRAGGFGATDDINSFLPVASDFTDFEAHLRDAQDYEDPGKEVNRHGLGWVEGTK